MLFPNVHELVTYAYLKYQRERVKIHLPHRDYVTTPGSVRLSSFNSCYLKAAYDKVGTPPDFPELTPEKNISTAWILAHGNYVAPMVQEALLYLAMTDPDVNFEAELPVVGTIGGILVSGRLDGLLSYRNSSGERISTVIEIKDTEGYERRSVGDPKLAYCLQALSYCQVTGTSDASIICVSKWGFNTYDLRPTASDPREYLLYDRFGNVWQPTAYWMENFNNPSQLSHHNLLEQLIQLREYQDTVAVGLTAPTVPFPDPVNHPKGWYCIRHLQKPTKTKDGLMVPNCPHAGKCHGLENRQYTTEKQADGSITFV